MGFSDVVCRVIVAVYSVIVVVRHNSILYVLLFFLYSELFEL